MPQLASRFVLIWRDPLSVEEAFNAALTEAGYFDVLINNAGAGHFDPAEHRSDGNDREPVSNSRFRANPVDATRTCATCRHAEKV